MQITIDIDSRLFNNLKSQADNDRITVEELIEECLEENYG